MTSKEWKASAREITPHTVGTSVSFMVAGMLADLSAAENEIAALRDAIAELKRFVEGERHDPENIAGIINGALKMPNDQALRPARGNEKDAQ